MKNKNKKKTTDKAKQIVMSTSYYTINKLLMNELGMETAIILHHLIDLRANIYEDTPFFQQLKRIAESTKLSLYSVKRGIKKLKKLGLIKVKKSTDPTDAKNYYIICDEKLEEFHNDLVNAEKEKEQKSKSFIDVSERPQAEMSQGHRPKSAGATGRNEPVVPAEMSQGHRPNSASSRQETRDNKQETINNRQETRDNKQEILPVESDNAFSEINNNGSAEAIMEKFDNAFSDIIKSSADNIKTDKVDNIIPAKNYDYNFENCKDNDFTEINKLFSRGHINEPLYDKLKDYKLSTI